MDQEHGKHYQTHCEQQLVQMFNTCIHILITILLVFLIITMLLIMLIKYNRAWLIDLKKLAKPGNLSGFPFSTIRRIRELKIQNRIQQQKRTN